MKIVQILVICGAISVWACVGAAAETSDLPRRIFDFSPVSAENPVVLRIDGDAVPLSELRAFVAAERHSRTLSQLTAQERREALRDLADEHLMVAEARRLGAEQHPLFRQRVDYTRKMLLAEFLVAERVGAEARTANAYAEGLARLRREVFEACSLEVSNESHALLTQIATEEGAELSQAGSPDVEREILSRAGQRAGEALLAHSPDNKISVPVRKALMFYLYLPPEQRPAVATQAGLTDLLCELLLPDLFAAEALRLGLERTEAFRAKIAENESALLRMYMRDRWQKAGWANPPTDDELKRWYQDHHDKYRSASDSSPAPQDWTVSREQVLADVLENRMLAERRALLDEARRRHEVHLEEAVVQAAL